MGDRLRDKVAVITGAASGIGAVSARRFIEEGARVIVADRQVDAGKLVADELGEAARFVECDVTDEAAIETAIGAAIGAWGRLDVMFNNAGVGGPITALVETESEEWRRTFDVLVNSVFYGCKQAARVMLPQGSGVILNTSSVAGLAGGLAPHAYTTAKTAVLGLTRSVAAELAPHGVRCNAIAPGTVPTPMTAAAIMGDAADLAGVAELSLRRIGKAGDAADVANAAIYLASDEAGFVTGHTLVVDYGRSTNAGGQRLAPARPT